MDAWIERVNNASAAWLDFMLAVSWQAALLVIAVALIAKMLSKSPPAARYWLWQIVACKLLVMPLWGLTLAMPWPTNGVETPPRQTELESSQTSVAAETSGAPANGHQLAATERPWVVAAALRLNWQVWLAVAWLTVVVALFARVVIQYRRLGQLLHQSTPAGDELLAMIGEIASRLQLHKFPRVLLTERSCSPFVCGIWRPTLVLPRSLVAELTPAQLRQALAHELAHVARRDLAWGWPAEIARIVYFFNPAVHWVGWHLRLERELACDQLALVACGERPAEYVNTLVQVVSHLSLPGILQTLGASQQAIAAERK
jgi:beta-lactamase regulating signal transducer with metallopeptidase domain